jgi:hypothetical protein
MSNEGKVPMTQSHKIDLRRLGSIGARGMVIHAGTRGGGTYAFYAVNTQETWRKFLVEDKDMGTFAQKQGFNVEDLRKLIDNSVSTAVLKTRPDVQAQTVLLNLDAFQELADTPGDGPGAPRQDPPRAHGLPSRFALLIHEEGKYYAPPTAEFHPLEGQDAGEAKILVRRGAVAAAIPNNDIPIGTDCVLVNLTEILPDSDGGAK